MWRGYWLYTSVVCKILLFCDWLGIPMSFHIGCWEDHIFCRVLKELKCGNNAVSLLYIPNRVAGYWYELINNHKLNSCLYVRIWYFWFVSIVCIQFYDNLIYCLIYPLKQPNYKCTTSILYSVFLIMCVFQFFQNSDNQGIFLSKIQQLNQKLLIFSYIASKHGSSAEKDPGWPIFKRIKKYGLFENLMFVVT